MASSIVTSTARQLGGLVVEEFKYLYEVSDKIERLQHDLQWMLCFLEDADNRQNREKVVAMWVSTIRELTYEAEEIVESYVHTVSNPRQNGGWGTMIKWWSCALFDARALHEVGSNIDDMRGRIGELISRLQLYGVKVTNADVRTRTTFVRTTYSHVEQDPVGLEEHTREVVEQLVRNEQVKVVGMCGMGGLGKTTLARQVIRDRSMNEVYKGKIAWVCISKQFETRKVFMEILTGLSDEEQRKGISSLLEGQLPQNICEALSQHKCLVVLDDVWEYDDWDALKPAFESIRDSQSKILITTRNRGLAEHIDLLGYSLNLNLLSDEDSWKLFQRIAFAQGDNPDGDMNAKEELGREMLKNCKGLPLAILTLGGVLCKKKTFVEWQNVQKNIKSYLMGDSRQTNRGLFAVMELSYNELPYYLKPCFMYLGHFPEDCEISVDRLYHLWEAEGLVTKSEDEEVEDASLDEIAESYLNELVERCLVQVGDKWVNGRIKTCRVHDVVRLMCIKKCQEVSFLKTISTKQTSSRNKIVSSSSINMKLHRCALYLDGQDDESIANSSAPWIRSLLVFQDEGSNWKRSFLTADMKMSLLLLRVLDLEGAKIPIQRKGIKDLIHLRYLSFFNCETLTDSELPDFWDCKYLETLDLRCNDTTARISNEFWRLQRLRHLYLAAQFTLLGDEKKLSLTDNQLEQLETIINFNAGYFDLESLWKMRSLRVFRFSNYNGPLGREEVEHFLKLPMIATKHQAAYPVKVPLMVDVVNGDTSMITTLASHACITELYVQGVIEDISRLEIFARYLTKLEFRDTEFVQQDLEVIEKLPVLTTLYLLGGSYVDNKMSFSSGGFPKLNTLWLQCTDLEEWEISEDAISNLQVLILTDCKKLTMIPSGLPKTVRINCDLPIPGIENFST